MKLKMVIKFVCSIILLDLRIIAIHDSRVSLTKRFDSVRGLADREPKIDRILAFAAKDYLKVITNK